jgi:hypothetical protein
MLNSKQAQSRSNRSVNRPKKSVSKQPDRSDSLFPEDGSDDGRFSVSEEINVDQQPDAIRHVGRMSDENDADEMETANAMKKSLQREPGHSGNSGNSGSEESKKSIRHVVPSSR